MDLVDLNYARRVSFYVGYCRDPYGSRGSKSGSRYFTDLVSNRRDPYGSRGSK